MATRARPSPKRIVYLWGAGATHAEARRAGATLNLLMRDDDDFGPGVTRRILDRLGRRLVASYGLGEGVDIEKLISLLAASGTSAHADLAERMREAYFRELRSSLATAKILDKPSLTIELLQLYRDIRFTEEVETLSGVITTNHDGLMQLASHEVFRRVNIGFPYASTDYTSDDEHIAPPILQLHGSFTWKFGAPIQIGRLKKTSKYDQSVWIPPTILKESKNYPFNKLAGLAYELLVKKCDVLRVVGASLTQNDWNILSLIFNAQRHREATKQAAFRVELIMPHKVGENIKRDCAYLKNITPIGYLSEGRFAEYKDANIPPESDLANPFAYWLEQKLEYHRSKGEMTSVTATRQSASHVGAGL